jgi:hypothetical protein
MPERWSIYNLYPRGKGVQNTPQQLNEARLRVEDILKKTQRSPAYEWFTLLYDTDRVKFATRAEDAEDIRRAIEDELKKQYPDLHLENGKQDQPTCELMAIAAQCRTVLEERVPISKWTPQRIARILHFMLNPAGYYREAEIYQNAFLKVSVALSRSPERGP